MRGAAARHGSSPSSAPRAWFVHSPLVRAVLVNPGRGLEVGEVPDPTPGRGQLLVAVEAAGLNRADLAVRAGAYRTGAAGTAPTKPFVAGGELAGTVAAVGEGVEGWREGDRVMALGPGYAELAPIDAAVALPVPADLTWEEAGSLPVGLYTMHDALVTNGGLVPGRSVMVNAATAGIGAIGIRIAAQLGASVVIATSRSRAKLDVLAEFLGALACPLVTVDLASEDAVEVTRAHTGGQGVDIIADSVGAGALATNVAAAAILGRIAQIGRLGGRTDELDLDRLARRRISLSGVTSRTRTRDEVRAAAVAARRDLGERLTAVAPRVDRVFPLADAIAAQDVLASDTQVGKIVLVP